MAKGTAPKDAFMNFVGITKTLDAADSSVLVEGVLNTGLSIRGGMLWLIHLIEVYMSAAEADYNLKVALSTRQGMAALPELNDDGTVAFIQERGMLTTSGFPVILRPLMLHYLPPVPLATPQLSLYAKSVADVAALQGSEVQLRIGFTTAPLDAASYQEVAETWGW